MGKTQCEVTYGGIFAKFSPLINHTSSPISHLEQIRGIVEQIKYYHEDTIRQIQTREHLTDNRPELFKRG